MNLEPWTTFVTCSLSLVALIFFAKIVTSHQIECLKIRQFACSEVRFCHFSFFCWTELSTFASKLSGFMPMLYNIRNSREYMAKLVVDNLGKVFSTELVKTVALKNVSLTVDDGEFVAVMGPSGCGKSTLLNILGLLDNPTEGSYRFDGREVSTLREGERSDYRKGKIGFVFQTFNLIDEMTVEENITLPLTNQGVPREEKASRVRDIMDRVGISHRAKHYPNQLSGGQQQRVAIARAVVGNPGIILADEPTGNLDSKNGHEVMELLAQLNREGATIIMVTHSQKDAQYAHRIINLFDGQIVDSLINRM